MKKVKNPIIIGFFIILSLNPVFGAGVSSEENQFGFNKQYDFRHVHWGMSKEDVFNSESYIFSEYLQEETKKHFGENIKNYLAKVEVDKTEANLSYGFAFDRLLRAAYDFSGDEKSYAADLQNFQKFIDLFTDEYGSPVPYNEAYTHESFEKAKNTLLEGDPDKKYDIYAFYLRWDTENESIILYAARKFHHYNLGIIYISKKYSYLFDEAVKLETERKEAENSGNP